METVIVWLKNSKAKKILRDLAELDLIELKETNDTDKMEPPSKISDLKELIRNKMSEEEIDQQLESLRQEWQRNI
ncbi:MAG TPA: hypothetical protein VN958_05610 [Chitinophagaceae bacterium]|nr:hypothetical protein [Chitinophagaceae bacterium]